MRLLPTLRSDVSGLYVGQADGDLEDAEAQALTVGASREQRGNSDIAQSQR